MRKRFNFQFTSFIFLLACVLLLSACGASTSSPPSPVPTNLPAPMDTAVPTETSQMLEAVTEEPEPTVSPTDTPEPTAAEPIQKRLERLSFDRPDISMTLPEGDPERGAKLALGRVCITCHVNSEEPPRLGTDGDLPAIWERAALRIADPAYSGYATTQQEYLLESITDPRLYEVDGNWLESMADNYYDLPVQDLADLIAWLKTFE